MTTLTKTSRLAALALLAAAVAAPVAAQSGSENVLTGSSTLGGGMNILAQNAADRAERELGAAARMFGSTYRMVGVAAESVGAQVRNDFSFELGGNTVLSVSRQGVELQVSRSGSFGKDRERTYSIGGIPVSVEVGMDVNAEVGMTLNTNREITGSAEAAITGTGRAGLDLLLYRAGVEASVSAINGELELARTGVELTMRALRIQFAAFVDKAKFYWKGWSLRRKWSRLATFTLIDWSAYQRTYRIL